MSILSVIKSYTAREESRRILEALEQKKQGLQRLEERVINRETAENPETAETQAIITLDIETAIRGIRQIKNCNRTGYSTSTKEYILPIGIGDGVTVGIFFTEKGPVKAPIRFIHQKEFLYQEAYVLDDKGTLTLSSNNNTIDIQMIKTDILKANNHDCNIYGIEGSKGLLPLLLVSHTKDKVALSIYGSEEINVATFRHKLSTFERQEIEETMGLLENMSISQIPYAKIKP